MSIQVVVKIQDNFQEKHIYKLERMSKKILLYLKMGFGLGCVWIRCTTIQISNRIQVWLRFRRLVCLHFLLSCALVGRFDGTLGNKEGQASCKNRNHWIIINHHKLFHPHRHLLGQLPHKYNLFQQTILSDSFPYDST